MTEESFPRIPLRIILPSREFDRQGRWQTTHTTPIVSDSTSSSDGSTGGTHAVDDQSLFHTTMLLRAQTKRCRKVMTLLFIFNGIVSMATAGLTLLLPKIEHKDSQQLASTVFTIMNIAGILCIMQGISWTKPAREHATTSGGMLWQQRLHT